MWPRGEEKGGKVDFSRSPLGVLKFYSPTNTHQRPAVFQELGWGPGSTNMSGTWSVLRSSWSHWGGNGIALPSPTNSLIHLCIYSLDSMCVRPCAGHQRCSDEEDGPRLC